MPCLLALKDGVKSLITAGKTNPQKTGFRHYLVGAIDKTYNSKVTVTTSLLRVSNIEIAVSLRLS